jgi:hypothetical protein
LRALSSQPSAVRSMLPTGSCWQHPSI